MYMAEVKQNKVWLIAFWAVFAVVIMGGIVFFAWNREEAPAENITATCTTKVQKGTVDDVDKYGPNEVRITAENFETEVLQSKGVVLIDVYASWCSHCQAISTSIAKLADDYVGRVKVGKMDANNQDPAMKANFDFAVEKGLQGYPTIWIYKDGVKVDEFSGEKTYCEMVELLDKQL